MSSTPSAEPVIVIGPVRTMDESQPLAEAFAVSDGLVVAVGGTADVRAALPGAHELHHEGLVTPGLVDSHLHFQRGGLKAVRYLDENATLDDFLALCAETADDDDDWWPGQEPTLDDRREGIRRGQRYSAALGLTGAIDPAVTLAEWEGYSAARANGELALRFVAMPWIPIADGSGPAAARVLEGLEAFGGRTGEGDDHLRLGGTKLYLDGEGMKGEALLEKPWGHSGLHGVQRLATDDLVELVVGAAKRGWGAGCHAVGSAAVAVALDAYAAAADAGVDIAALRYQLIHAYLEPSIQSRRRAAALGVIASLQPSLLYSNAEGLFDRLGERALPSNPMRDWLDDGATVALGSDGPYFPFDPRLLMDQAVARITLHQPEGGFGASQAVSVEEALRSLTVAGAVASFAEERRGRIAVGMQADWVLWDRDPLLVPGNARSLTALRTVVGGTVVHDIL